MYTLRSVIEQTLVGPSKQFKLSITLLRIPIDWRQTSWLFTMVAEDLNSGLRWNNCPGSSQRGTETWARLIASPTCWPLSDAACYIRDFLFLAVIIIVCFFYLPQLKNYTENKYKFEKVVGRPDGYYRAHK